MSAQDDEDIETINPAARGCILREAITDEANWRAVKHFNDWLSSHNLPAICGVDTRALTAYATLVHPMAFCAIRPMEI